MADTMDAKRTYAKYRIEKAKDDLEAAKIMYQDGHYRVAFVFNIRLSGIAVE